MKLIVHRRSSMGSSGIPDRQVIFGVAKISLQQEPCCQAKRRVQLPKNAFHRDISQQITVMWWTASMVFAFAGRGRRICHRHSFIKSPGNPLDPQIWSLGQPVLCFHVLSSGFAILRTDCRRFSTVRIASKSELSLRLSAATLKFCLLFL